MLEKPSHIDNIRKLKRFNYKKLLGFTKIMRLSKDLKV